MKPRIILLDIETSPTLGYVWGMWEQNVIAVEDDWFMLSFAVKELGAKKTRTHCLPDYRGYVKDKQNDAALLWELWNEMDKSDVIIAHNGDGFDIKKSNSRFIYHGLKPPSPYKTIDTLKIARKHFGFTSNKLDDLADYLKVGRKLPHQGKHTWLGCMTGDKKQWNTMRKYNAHDLNLLEGCYMHMRPWATTHVNLNNYRKDNVCPRCQSHSLIGRGYIYTKTGKRQQFQCKNCGGWSSGIKHFREAA